MLDASSATTLRFLLILLLAPQIDAPRPLFVYSDGTACAERVITWTRDLSEVLLITLPGHATDMNSRTFQVGSARAKVDVRVFFGMRGFRKCGQDLGPSFDDVATEPAAWTAVGGSALVYVSSRSTIVTVVLRDVTFKSSTGQFTVPGVVRVTTELNNFVAG